MLFRLTGRLLVFQLPLAVLMPVPAWSITVEPAPLARLAVESDGKAAPAGDAVKNTVRAVDGMGNTLTACSPEYRGIRINAAGAQVTPDFLAPAPQPAPPAGVTSSPASAQPKVASAPVQAKPSDATARELRPGFLDDVKVEERTDLALVSFSTNGMADYTVSTSAKLSRKWIDLHFPTLKPDLPGHMRGGEKIVGEVYVEEIPTGGVTVSVEILPVHIGYEIYMEGDGLVLKIQRQ